MRGGGHKVRGAKHDKPTFFQNLAFFFDYQMNWMYWRYFMWNFVGRQNDLHATVPGDKIKGNWESGIGFLDKMRLGDQSEGPDYIVDSKSKNHYYFLPLILGLLGLFYQLKKDKQNWVVTMLLFILTGIAIVVYLNQPPMQPRERDYAYAGSFYAFAIWIGMGVAAIVHFIQQRTKKESLPLNIAVSVACLLVPVQMVSQTWDDHDRSDRYMARDFGANYLNSLPEKGYPIIITNGDKLRKNRIYRSSAFYNITCCT